MGVTNSLYTKFLKTLLPKGDAWTRALDSNWHKFLSAIADELVRVHTRGGVDLLKELYPATSLELLDDWERILNLPDDCIGEAVSTQDRRNQILYRLTNQGGQSPQFFIDLAAQLGYTITITEFDQFRAGISVAGDALTNGDWCFAWQVNAPDNTVNYFRAGLSTAGDPLAYWNNDPLECIINRAKPAHTVVLFAYGA